MPIGSLRARDSLIPTLSTSSISFRCKLAFYANDSQLSNRKASFGYGTKVDFTKDRTCSPPATKYNPKTFLEESSKSGKSFGLNREKVVDKSFYLPSHRLKLPGPGMVNVS